MRTFLKVMGTVMFVALLFIGGLFLIKSHSFHLYEKHKQDFREPLLSVLSPLKNDTVAEALTVQQAGNVSLKIWAECYWGHIDVSVCDARGNVLFHKGGRELDLESPLYLPAGKYQLRLRFERVFPALAILQVTDGAVDPAAYQIIPLLDKKLYTRVNPAPHKGFYWPYYLYAPQHISRKQSQCLLVMPNNSGTTADNLLLHENGAVQLLTGSGAGLAKELGIPLLVPVFPRPAKYENIYTHALDRDSLLTGIPEIKRLDRQLIAMIDDARARLMTQHKLRCGEKVLLWGFSASGMFANRFAVLHPDRIQAAAIGSPGGWPIVPIARYKGNRLRYPIGVADLKHLTGQEFERKTFQKVPLYFYIGSRDTNDSVPFDDSYDAADRPIINACFGKTPVGRWPAAQRFYRNNRCAAQFVTYPLAGHEITPKMTQDIMKFLRKNL